MLLLNLYWKLTSASFLLLYCFHTFQCTKQVTHTKTFRLTNKSCATSTNEWWIVSIYSCLGLSEFITLNVFLLTICWTHTWRDLADSGRVPTITLITVGALDKDSTVTETLCKHLSSDVIQPYTTPLEIKKTEQWMSLRAAVITGCIWLTLDLIRVEYWAPPMCLRVNSTAALRLTLDNNPRQKRSELEGSVKPSTVSEGCEAWKVSPTRWFSS